MNDHVHPLFKNILNGFFHMPPKAVSHESLNHEDDDWGRYYAEVGQWQEQEAQQPE